MTSGGNQEMEEQESMKTLIESEEKSEQSSIISSAYDMHGDYCAGKMDSGEFIHI